MKRFFLWLLAAVSLAACGNEDEPIPCNNGENEKEVALYDHTMTAVAYIDCTDADSTIYLWDGRPVAYLTDKEDVFQYNGHFLGWYKDGLLFGRDGQVVGAELSVVFGEVNTLVTHAPTARSPKQAKPAPHIRNAKPAPPLFEGKWSQVGLTDWLLDEDGAKAGDRP